MLLENTWNRITAWFHKHSERAKLISGFNNRECEAFIAGVIPTALKASVSSGVSAYKHEFSSWFNTGFRIRVLNGHQLSKQETMLIGQAVLSDTTLVRRLIVLGWDTLEIYSEDGNYGCRWKLVDYANISFMQE